MTDTRFRTWMTQLCEPAGDRPEWPLVFQWTMQEQLRREQEVARTYDGSRILIPRSNRSIDQIKKPENRAVYGLYHECLAETDGCLTIDEDKYWLISYEVPSQENRKGQRADLLGLTTSGGLVIFEGKLGANRYTPIAALLEGLDYLACLTSRPNFVRVRKEFSSLKTEIGVIPKRFDDIEPTADACHEVIVLAPLEYYRKYDSSGRGTGWQSLSILHDLPGSVRLGFAVSEPDSDGFFSRQVHWCDSGS